MSTKQINQIKGLLKTLEEDKQKLYNQLGEVRSNQTFKCLCGKYHKIKNTDVIVTLGWSQGCGYEDGYSYDRAFFAACPTIENVYNRFLYPSYFKVQYSKQQDYDFNAQKQFENVYKSLFKSVTKVDDVDFKGKWGNNEYIDNNHSKFGIDITGGLK